MTNALLQLKFKERLNRLDSMDYDSFFCWQIVEAYNKARTAWIRRQLHGTNTHKEGNEQSLIRIDDLQVLLQPLDLSGTNQKLFFESLPLPSNYLEFKRVSTHAKTSTCGERTMKVYLAEESDTDLLLGDRFKGPDFEWAETFCTLFGNKLRIYTNDAFEIINPKLVYYRKPIPVTFKGCVDPSTGQPAQDQPCELKDDIIEIIIDEAVSILAGDIKDMENFQRGIQAGERDN